MTAESVCQYVGCIKPGPEVRKVISGKTHLAFCGRHDPLEDDAVASVWEAVDA